MRLPLTYPGLPGLRKVIAKTLYPRFYSLCMNVESIDGLGGLLGIKVEVWVEHISVKRRAGRWEAHVTRELTFPLLRFEQVINLCVSRDGMSYNHREVSFQVTPTRFHKVIIETTRVLLLREGRKGNTGEATRQGGMQDNKMGKSTR